MTRVDRRTFVAGATVGAVWGLGCGPEPGELAPTRVVANPEPEPEDGAQAVSFDPEAVPRDDAAFPDGVLAGDMAATRARLWTRVADPSAGFTLRVWREAEAAGEVLLVVDTAVSPNSAGYLEVEVEGLGPSGYVYAFFDAALSRRSPIGRFRTAFAEGDLRPLSLGLVACTNYQRAPFPALGLLAEERPDVVIHLGDLSYNDGATDLDTYRRLYRRTLQTETYRALLGNAGIYPTWDDHEITNNFDPETLEPARLALATQAWFETLPVPEDAPLRLWRSHRWGATAEIFMLDCRSERKPSTLGSGAEEYISEAQMSWLLEALEQSPCHFKIIASSVPFTRLFGLWNLAKADRWQGYEAQRERLLAHLVDRVSGRVIFVAGDFHCGFVSRVEPEGPGTDIFEVTVSTAPASINPVAALYETGDVEPENTFPPEQFPFGTGKPYCATTLVLDPLNDEAKVKFVDGSEANFGTVLYDALLPFA